MSVMTAVADILPHAEADWGKRAHVARGVSRALALTLHNEAYFRLIFPCGVLRSTPAEATELRQRLTALFETDWQNVRDGVYPEALVHDFSWWKLLTAWPRLISDAPAVRRRAFADIHDELPRHGGLPAVLPAQLPFSVGGLPRPEICVDVRAAGGGPLPGDRQRDAASAAATPCASPAGSPLDRGTEPRPCLRHWPGPAHAGLHVPACLAVRLRPEPALCDLGSPLAGGPRAGLMLDRRQRGDAAIRGRLLRRDHLRLPLP